MSSRTIVFDDRLYDYYLNHAVREPDSLKALRVETAKNPHARMQISPEQGQLMHLLVKLTGATRALEVGVFTGYSSLAVALALPEDGVLVACEHNPDFAAIAGRHWAAAGVAHKVDLRLGYASEALDDLIANGHANAFDIAFVDADKRNYDLYYERCLALLRRGGLLLVDNVLWSGRVADPADKEDQTETIRALNDKIHADDRVEMCMLPIGDGLTMAVKR